MSKGQTERGVQAAKGKLGEAMKNSSVWWSHCAEPNSMSFRIWQSGFMTKPATLTMICDLSMSSKYRLFRRGCREGDIIISKWLCIQGYKCRVWVGPESWQEQSKSSCSGWRDGSRAGRRSQLPCVYCSVSSFISNEKMENRRSMSEIHN